MKYTTILFDLDDTLFDFGKAEENAVCKLMQRYSIPDTEYNRNLYIEMNKKKWRALESGEITRHQLFSTRFSEFFDTVGIDADGITANEEYIKYLGEGCFPIDGAEDICRELSEQYKLYIITNGAKIAQQGRLNGSKISEYMSGVFISEEIGFDKPDIRYFDYVFEHIEEKDKSKILVVGDSLYSDIEGAVRFGIDSCWINTGKKQNNKATYEINSISEIKIVLNT